MLLIPTQPLASQTINALISNQATTLNIYQKGNNPASWALFMDVLVNDALLLGGVICQNLNVIIRDAYFGYQGDFAWFDTQGVTDPVYTGLGTRYQLWWFAPSELSPGLS